jgi:mono/diheme cytochrome c family protein
MTWIDSTRNRAARLILLSFMALWRVQLSAQSLAWDATSRDLAARFGESNLQFAFSVTNISATNIAITNVRPSCGCTVVKLPATPWTLVPGASGKLEGNIDLRGKSGALSKNIFVDTTAGLQILTTQIRIEGGPAAAPAGQPERTSNLQAALGDRQLVFRGDCAGCHVVPTVGKSGAALYQAACAICHDAPNRASMVPDLHNPKHPTDRDYWLNWVSHGKPGSLMPAFSQSEGGPLSGEQIQSLVEVLLKGVPHASRLEELSK